MKPRNTVLPLHSLLRRFVLIAVASFLGGCATTGSSPWGTQVTWAPGSERLASAAIDAAKNPHVWIPLAGAALFQVDHWDRRVSDWASDHTPIFNSQKNADDWSDRLRTLSSTSYYVSAIATPGPADPKDWLFAKGKGLAVGLGAIFTNAKTTDGLKSATGRTRPNGSDDESFPSGHASHAAVTTGLARDNLRYIEIGNNTRRALQVGLDTLAIGTSWARIEAGVHYPADTLVGFALGNFVSKFFDEAFLAPASDQRTVWHVTPLPDGVALQWAVSL